MHFGLFPESDRRNNVLMREPIENLSRVYFELIRIGNSVKVSAIDPTTNIEVSIVGSPHVGIEALKRVAIRKLSYVIRKQRSGR